MKTAVTAVQYLLGIFFLFSGVNHFLLPDGLPAMMAWMYDLSPALHWFSGSAEILASLTFLLAGRVDRLKSLVPYAAVGLVLAMVGAAVWHFDRGETSNIAQNTVLGLLSAFVAYGRLRIAPYKK
jgi:uncharacterized membrane protein